MDNITLNIKALAGMMNMSIEDLAKETGIDYNHLKMVSAGRVKMTASDLMQLHRVTGVPTENIRTD